MAEISVWISVFFSMRSMRARSTLRILPRMGRIAWVAGLRAGTAEPPAESPSTMNSSRSSRFFDEQSLSLSGMPAPSSSDLRPHEVAGLLGRGAGLGGGDALLDDLVGLGGILLEPVAQLLVGGPLHQRLHGGVAELGLGLALELRVAQSHGDDRRDALADVLALEVGVLLLEVVLGAGVLVDRGGERRLEALDVGAALDGVDAVGEAVDAVGVVGRVPLERDLDLGGRRPRRRGSRPWRTGSPSSC